MLFQHRYHVTESIGITHTKWPLSGIRVTEAKFLPDFGSTSSSWDDRGLKTGGYETLPKIISREHSRVVRDPSKYDMHRDLITNVVQDLEACR